MNKLIAVFLFITLNLSKSFALNYFVKSTGTNSATGTSDAFAWQTIQKVNDEMAAGHIVAGDHIYFNSGDDFFGHLVVTVSGTLTNPIVFGAYGSGAAPIINAGKVITLIASGTPGIYVSNVALTPEAKPRNFVMDGQGLQLARFPNKGATGTGIISTGYLSNTAVTSTYVEDDWTGISVPAVSLAGGKIGMRSKRFHYDVKEIDSVTGTSTHPRIYFDATAEVPTVGHGFVLLDKEEFMDVNGEYYFNSTTSYIKVKLDAAPGSRRFEMPVYEYGIYADGKNYITIQNLEVRNANQYNINLNNCDYSLVSNCTTYDGGIGGINIQSSTNPSIISCNAYDGLSKGIRGSANTNMYIGYCKVYNTMLNPTMSRGGGSDGTGISMSPTYGNSTIEYCEVYNSAYSGIKWGFEAPVTIQFNLVVNADSVLDDNGGLYTEDRGNFRHAGMSIIKNNIVKNCRGGLEGYPATTAYSKYETYGIYLDEFSANHILDSNTVINCSSGILCNTPRNVAIKHTSILGHRGKEIYINGRKTAITQRVDSLIITGNKFLTSRNYIASGSTVDSVAGGGIIYASDVNGAAQINAWGVIDSNWYGSPFSSQAYIRNDGTAQTLSAWRSATPYDDHSTEVTYANKPALSLVAGDLFMAVNYTDATQNINLGTTIYKGLDGTTYEGTIAVPRFFGIPLMRSGTTSPLPETPVENIIKIKSNKHPKP